MLDRLPRPVFILVLLALLAQGLAFGTNAIVARKLSVAPDRLAAVTRPGADPAGAERAAEDNGGATAFEPGSKRGANLTRRLNWFQDPIVHRNLFDSANALAGKKDTEGSGDPEDEAQKSDLDIVLIATSAASDRTWSTAMMAVSKGPPNLFYMAEVVLDAEIIEINNPWLDSASVHHPGRVVFLRDGQREYIDIGGTPKAGARRKGAAKKTAKKRGGRHKWDGISSLGGGKYSIEQSEIDYALANLDKLSREARVVPNFADGAANGFKVFSIRRTSALRKMGLKNNDVLTSVNGFDLSNTNKALEIYSKLQSDKNFTLEILRNGEPMTMEYSVQ
jgi:general secretion pathway protein C